ncbi:hypothetical protein SEA_GIRR_39 [Mycobacterium phage Girr]|uniref:Uncharacterized protein n=1 Tax=Mycobacterium phage Girr TaxID=2301565 RepID=A0A385DP26_9CAUD|nr:hypothetical protein I5H43_gp039 [Mycobacterium phage Girr]AXQ61054.1 hypothetical protein SEA_GIRR_39 [Mycobacterium phage Girr]QAY06142.1 hypothetical protein SEA_MISTERCUDDLES_39 [Mycobacterium phage MisterCuddles]
MSDPQLELWRSVWLAVVAGDDRRAAGSRPGLINAS